MGSHTKILHQSINNFDKNTKQSDLNLYSSNHNHSHNGLSHGHSHSKEESKFCGMSKFRKINITE
jgi:hypothetical protein